MDRSWNQALDLLKSQIDGDAFEAYVRTLRPRTLRDRSLLVEAASRDAMEVVNARFLGQIEASLSQVTRLPMRVVVQPPPGVQQELFPVAATASAAPPENKLRRESGIDSRLSFDSFIVGGSNQFAHAAAKAVASIPGDHYNPLFIYGPDGLGKTHLVHAIGNQILDTRPGCRVAYVTAESFTNELITSLRRDNMEAFKNRFRRVDVLIVDDVQALAGRDRTQEEFFHTFNSLYEARKQIILTADRLPKEIAGLEERLRNRFEWGLIADIQPPEVETRVAILQHRAESQQIDLPPDVAMTIATAISSNISDLENALSRIAATASFEHTGITVDFAKRILREFSAPDSRPLTIDDIQKVVCDFYQLKPSDLRSRSRARAVAVPRQVAMYLCRRHTDASFPTIGDRFGGRDHSTVIHAATSVEQRIQDDPGLRASVDRLEQLLIDRG